MPEKEKSYSDRRLLNAILRRAARDVAAEARLPPERAIHIMDRAQRELKPNEIIGYSRLETRRKGRPIKKAMG